MPSTRRYALVPAFLCLAALAAPVDAQAQRAGTYLSAHAGLTGQRDQTLLFRQDTDALASNASFDSGFISGAAVGYRFENGWRLEGEFSYQTVDLFDPPFAQTTGPQGDGNYASTSVALNVLYEFDLLGSPRARTYLGVGAVRLTEVDIDFESGGSERSYSGSDSGFQLLAGARYDLGEHWFMDAGVRYLRAGGLRLDSEGSAGGQIEANYEPWAVTIGIGWQF